MKYSSLFPQCLPSQSGFFSSEQNKTQHLQISRFPSHPWKFTLKIVSQSPVTDSLQEAGTEVAARAQPFKRDVPLPPHSFCQFQVTVVVKGHAASGASFYKGYCSHLCVVSLSLSPPTPSPAHSPAQDGLLTRQQMPPEQNFRWKGDLSVPLKCRPERRHSTGHRRKQNCAEHALDRRVKHGIKDH